MGKYLLQSYLDESRQSSPDKPALIDEHGSVSYELLHAEAERMAQCLAEGGVRRQDRVVIWMKRSSQVVMAMLGALKADAIYVPVDSKAPVERVLKVLEDCRPAALVCDRHTHPAVQQVQERLQPLGLVVVMAPRCESECQGVVRKVYWDEVPRVRVLPRHYLNIDTDAAYILYTSGSTGTPKGVTVSHLNVINYIEWAVECFEITPRDKVLGTAPFHFDMSTFDIYTSLKAGATLCIAPEKDLLFPSRLLDLIEKEEVTIWKGVSSLLMYLSSTGSLKEERIPSLERVLFGGEVLPAKHLMNWMKTYPKKRFYNVYGPTETTGISAYYPVTTPPTGPDESIPIGWACANTEILVLTDDNRLAQTGETGELCIRGSGLSLGYWNDEEKTARSFVRNPLGYSQNDRIYRTGDLARIREDGVLEYLGRKDFQVKYMGYRIETFEVEKAILSLESVQQAAVLLCTSSQGEVAELVAFVEGSLPQGEEDVLQRLGRSLPPYMLPKQIIAVEKIPLNDRGKIDRGALRQFYQQRIHNAAGGVL